MKIKHKRLGSEWRGKETKGLLEPIPSIPVSSPAVREGDRWGPGRGDGPVASGPRGLAEGK